jgi:hypothetical protein
MVFVRATSRADTYALGAHLPSGFPDSPTTPIENQRPVKLVFDQFAQPRFQSSVRRPVAKSRTNKHSDKIWTVFAK